MKKLFFERQQEANGEIPTTFSYTHFPESLKTQMILIWRKAQGLFYRMENVATDLRMAIGVEALADGKERDGYNIRWNYWKEVTDFFLNENRIDIILTIVEEVGTHINDSSLIEEMNYRMQRAGVGYKHTGDYVIKIEDERFFEEATAPCLSILSQHGYEQTKTHFINAYDELKQRKYDDALADCGQALESIIKTRLSRAGIEYDKNYNLNRLLPLLKAHIVAPKFFDEYLVNLFKLLEGLATWRNKEGAHGKPEGDVSVIDDIYVRFVINQTSANILFLAEVEFSKSPMR